MSRLNQAQQATKAQLKARVALDGPSGAGKTWSALEWATVLAEGGRILVIDTEHGSASLYADRFTFETVVWHPPYAPGELADTIRDAARAGYSAIIVDSLSHFWEGEGGTRDMVDAAAEKAKGNTFAGWKVGTPALRHLIDTMLGADAHLIATMRSKMEYVLETDSKGRQVPRKVGMAPVMRAGVEYEFTLVGDLDLDHRIMVTKSRCSALADELVQPGRAAEAAAKFLAWLNDGEAVDPTAAPVETAAAKRELVAACGDDKLFASSLWGDRQTITRRDLDDLCAQARMAAADGSPFDEPPDGGQTAVVNDLPPTRPGGGEASPPDGVGGDAAVRETEVALETGEADPGRAAASPAAGRGATGSANPDTHDPNAWNAAMWVLVGKAWPNATDTERDEKRKTLIGIVSGRRTNSSKDLDDQERKVLMRTLEQIADRKKDLHLKADGTWVVQSVTLRGGGRAA